MISLPAPLDQPALVAIGVRQPQLLPDARLRFVAPIILPIHLRVRPPHGTVVIVILCPRMPHTRQCLARGSVEEIKKWPRIFCIEVPAHPLAAIDLQQNLVVRQKNL